MDALTSVNKQVRIKVTTSRAPYKFLNLTMAETASVSVAPFAPVNFAFDDLKTKMNRFTIRFDKWTQGQRQRVLKERNEFAKAIAESRGIALNSKKNTHSGRKPEGSQ